MVSESLCDSETDSTSRGTISTIPDDMLKATGFVTAGGRSTRMGRDKALLELGGRPIIEHIIEALQPVTSGLAVIANSDEYRRFGLPVYADTNRSIGPLEAIRTALANSPTPLVILTGCDMPFVTSELFAHLLEVANEIPQGTTEAGQLTPDFPFAVVPLNEEGKPEPLCAVYSTAALEAVSDLIGEGGRRVSLLFEKIACRLVSFGEISHLQNSDFFFENLNTPEDFERAVKKNVSNF
jgi:molybdopterin-guanine dinucleotide biosynthesis protein A